MPKEIIRPNGMLNSPGYSHAVIKPGSPVFISGQVAQDATGRLVGEGDIEAQVRQVFLNLRTVVNACGGSMDDIVKINVYVTDLAYRPAVAAARMVHFRPGFMPASTFVVVSSLADPRMLVEIEAVAMVE
jgi:2-iminobutanoate/2-iminopropanoate deaminase